MGLEYCAKGVSKWDGNSEFSDSMISTSAEGTRVAECLS